MYKCAVIKVAVMSTNENDLIVEKGGSAYIGELGHGFKPHISIHIHRCCVMDCTVQWDFEVDISGLILGLVDNDRCNEALTIRSGEDK